MLVRLIFTFELAQMQIYINFSIIMSILTHLPTKLQVLKIDLNEWGESPPLDEAEKMGGWRQ